MPTLVALSGAFPNRASALQSAGEWAAWALDLASAQAEPRQPWVCVRDEGARDNDHLLCALEWEGTLLVGETDDVGRAQLLRDPRRARFDVRRMML